jgi:lipid-A-disaccharide synthase
MSWRQELYPLGLIATVAFALRFVIQWYSSEKRKESVVPPSFWTISLFGNVLLLCHAFIQMQFHICCIQTCNGVISWRNLNLMQARERQWTLPAVLWLLLSAMLLLLAAYSAQLFLSGSTAGEWLRVPTTAWGNGADRHVGYGWHAVGVAGLLLFNCRFWVQWWQAERAHSSSLSELFWWMSLGGSVLLLAYFVQIGDIVNIVSPLFGLIPYVRNLMIMKRSKKVLSPQQP